MDSAQFTDSSWDGHTFLRLNDGSTMLLPGWNLRHVADAGRTEHMNEDPSDTVISFDAPAPAPAPAPYPSRDQSVAARGHTRRIR